MNVVIPHSDAALTFWIVVATFWAMYGGFSLTIWYYTRSEMSALASALAFWLFVITSSIGLMQSPQSRIGMSYLIMMQRAAWIPAILIYWLIIDSGLRHGNGRLTRLRHIWRFWERK